MMNEICTDAPANVGEGSGATSACDLELTILMPCLNEVRTVKRCIQKAQGFLRRANVQGEILVADNGSCDGSIASALALGARVEVVPERGYGAALIAGISAAKGRYVIMGDADDSYDFERLDPFLQRLRSGDDLVMGNRFLGGIASGAMPWHHRYLGNPVLSFIGRQFFKSPVRDFHCGLRGFRRDAITGLGLSCKGMEFASEMIVKATLNALRVSEVPTTLSQDGRDRPPHLRSFRDGWRHLRFLLVHCPRWLFLYPGILLLGLGIGMQWTLLGGPVTFGHVVFDIHTMLYAAALSIIGAQISIFGVLSQFAAFRLGILPSVPKSVKWAEQAPLEYGLLAGGALFLCGICWATVALLSWADVGFSAIDPTSVMRSAIPSVTLMIMGVELFFASFFFSVLRLKAERRDMGAGKVDAGLLSAVAAGAQR